MLLLPATQKGPEQAVPNRIAGLAERERERRPLTISPDNAREGFLKHFRTDTDDVDEGQTWIGFQHLQTHNQSIPRKEYVS